MKEEPNSLDEATTSDPPTGSGGGGGSTQPSESPLASIYPPVMRII